MNQKQLELIFTNEAGGRATFVIKDAKEDLTQSQIEPLMAQLVDLDLFVKGSERAYVAPVGARYTQRVVDEIFLVD